MVPCGAPQWNFKGQKWVDKNISTIYTNYNAVVKFKEKACFVLTPFNCFGSIVFCLFRNRFIQFDELAQFNWNSEAWLKAVKCFKISQYLTCMTVIVADSQKRGCELKSHINFDLWFFPLLFNQMNFREKRGLSSNQSVFYCAPALLAKFAKVWNKGF